MNIEFLPTYKTLTGLIEADILLSRWVGELEEVHSKEDKGGVEQNLTKDKLNWEYDLSDCVADFENTLNAVNLPLFRIFVDFYDGHRKSSTTGKRSPRYTLAMETADRLEQQLRLTSLIQNPYKEVKSLRERGYVSDSALLVAQVDKMEQLSSIRDNMYLKLATLDSYTLDPQKKFSNTVGFIAIAVECYISASYKTKKESILGCEQGVDTNKLVKELLAEKVIAYSNGINGGMSRSLQCLIVLAEKLELGAGAISAIELALARTPRGLQEVHSLNEIMTNLKILEKYEF